MTQGEGDPKSTAAVLGAEGLRIVNNTLPKISLRSLPGFGHQVDFNTQLLVESSVPGQALCEQVEVDATMVLQDTWTAHQNALNCKTVDINIDVRPRVPVLDEPLKRLLRGILQDLGCNIINARLKVLSSLLGSRNQVLPLGALGDLPSFSILSGDAIQMDLNLLSENARPGTVMPTQGLPLTASLQLATGRPPRLSLSQDTLSALLEQVQGQGALNLSITSLTGSRSPLQGQVPQSGSSLTMSALFPFIPQLTRVVPGSLPLELRVRVSKEPVVTVRDGRATVTLKATIEFISSALQSPQGLLFSLDVDVVLSITPSVSDGKLQTSLALDSINLTRFPPSLDAPTASSLTEWLKEILTAVYVPSVKDAFSVSVPLPNVLNINLRNAEVDITDVDEFSGQTALGRSCWGGASMLLPL
ncbi:BPI fold-containing family B member 4-like [Hirundo rustica]|uniref:BPI fold-containing family B member 4-like n=1 Tax=Hirundo rustica TaxID=43150 RepID=UPI001A93E2A0|nr:BPI fold-containing family B member 4-like [Hirundo rustica]